MVMAGIGGQGIEGGHQAGEPKGARSWGMGEVSCCSAHYGLVGVRQKKAVQPSGVSPVIPAKADGKGLLVWMGKRGLHQVTFITTCLVLPKFCTHAYLYGKTLGPLV